MSLKCGLFDSTEIVEEVGGYPRGDKAQGCSIFAQYFKGLWVMACYPSPTTNFQVIAQSGFTVQMRPGGIYANGYFAYDEEPLTLTIGGVLARRTGLCHFPLGYGGGGNYAASLKYICAGKQL